MSVAKTVTLEKLICSEDPAKEIKTLSFENGIKLLEELVEQVESGSMPLDQSILSYEKGTLLIGQLKKLLAGAEQKLMLLKNGQVEEVR